MQLLHVNQYQLQSYVQQHHPLLHLQQQHTSTNAPNESEIDNTVEEDEYTFEGAKKVCKFIVSTTNYDN